MLSTVQLYYFCWPLALVRNFLIAFHLNQPCTALEISSVVLLNALVVFTLPMQSQQHCTILCEVY